MPPTYPPSGDYRNGPNPADWDPTKWILWSIHNTFPSLIPSIKRTSEAEILRARASVLQNQADELMAQAAKAEGVELVVPDAKVSTTLAEEKLPVWSWEEIRRRVGQDDGEEGSGPEGRRWYLVVEGWVVDVTGYLNDHVSCDPRLCSKCEQY